MFGTPQKLYEHNGDTITDITPVSSSVTLQNAFTIALSATTVTVSATAHGREQEITYSLPVFQVQVEV